MNSNQHRLPLAAALLAALLSGCSAEDSSHDGHSHGPEGHGEHGAEHEGEHGGGGGEESGTQLALNERYDAIRHGARLILEYQVATNTFKGTVENTTEATLERVRVEVHLSNGRELGPTTPEDLGPGEKREVRLVAKSANFDAWSAHPGIGNEEHGHGEHEH